MGIQNERFDYNRPYMKSALENTPGGFFIYRAEDDRFLYANRKMIQLLECDSYEELLKFTDGKFSNIIFAEDRARMNESIDQQMVNSEVHFDHIEYRIRTKNGMTKFVEDFGQRIHDEEEGDLFYVYIIDYEQKLLAQDVDELTGLPRQRRFLAQAEKFQNMCKITRTSPVYIYFDLSNFKLFNVNYGVESGDIVLQDVAKILKESFPNDFVARSSEDRFMVLTDDFKMVERTLEVLEKIDNIRPHSNIYCRAGLCRMGEKLLKPEDALNLAREACASIRKDSPSHIQVYSSELANSLMIKAYVTQHIDEAIEKGWIEAYLQPVVSTETHKIISCEALARWVDPVLGFLSPGDFIGALEESNQISKLDMHMVELVCQYLSEKKASGERVVPISFNLSRQDFLQGDVFEKIEKIRRKYNVHPSKLHVEITESMLLSDRGVIKEAMDHFHECGHQIWMDDFGSGYSSLNLLKDFDFDELKIDMGFLSDFSDKSRIIIESIVQMAQKIGISTLAEGVETPEQYQFLSEIGCDKVQGYLISRPIPMSTLELVIKEIGVA